MKFKVSAVLCALNEEYYLDECLKSILWADEIILCDMGSIDSTTAIAKKYNCKVMKIDKVPYVELVRKEAVYECSNEWICFVDPDFIFPDEYIDDIQNEILKDPGITCIYMHYINHYKNMPVKHGRWGRGGFYPILFNKNAMDLLPILHNGFRLKSGRYFHLPESIYIKHMWIRDDDHFYDKHLRYVAYEGERRLMQGCKPSLLRTWNLVKDMLMYYFKDGFRDGKMGFDLLLKSIWYELESEKQLKSSYKKLSNHSSGNYKR